MNSKLYLVAIACLIGGLAGGYLIANNLSQNRLAAYELQIQAQEAQMQSNDAQIQAQVAQIQAQEALIQAYDAQIQVKDAQIQQLTVLTQSQYELIQLLEAQLATP